MPMFLEGHNDAIRYEVIIFTCAQELTKSQFNLLHAVPKNEKIKETKKQN